jgi:glyoxylase-like metal-dependent hydrolase (beta-lactamase superfamily II)
VVASYLLPGDEPALVDCGPSSCIDELESGLAMHGLTVGDLRHLLLTHIHLDHAGAAGVLSRLNGQLTIHVSEVGAPHLVDPSRLERSARRLYGEDFDRLWGELAPVPSENLHVVGGETLGLATFPSPGHASHHVCYLDSEGTLYAGDAAGVRIRPSEFVLPPTPPPEVDLEAWERTIDALERRDPSRMALIHFGVFADVERHLEELRRRLHAWAERVRAGATEEQFAAMAADDLAADQAAYEQAMPFWQSYAGLKRYWEKRAA